MASGIDLSNANGNNVLLVNPDTNNSDVTVDASVIMQRGLEKDINYKVTPITITSWGYVGTTITLNVVSHTFVPGDYIKTKGLTSTTYPANGIHLVTSVTPTTIVFTLGATPTGTAGISSATVEGYVTINGKISDAIGINQEYKTTGKSAGINYVNTSNKSEVGYIYGNTSSPGLQVNVILKQIGATTELAMPLGVTTSSGYGGFNLIVPPKYTYRVASTTGSFTVATWYELN